MASSNPKKLTYKFRYDFSVDGGSHSASNQGLAGNGAGVVTPADATATIPENAIITGCITYVSTAFAGTNCNLAIGCGGAAIVASTDFDNAVFADEKVTVHSVGDKTTSAARPTITFDTASATAGVMDVVLEYYLVSELGA